MNSHALKDVKKIITIIFFCVTLCNKGSRFAFDCVMFSIYNVYIGCVCNVHVVYNIYYINVVVHRPHRTPLNGIG